MTYTRKKDEKTLDELRDIIKSEAVYVDKKQFSHNIITLCLQAISKLHGNAEADKAIDDFDLVKLGWRKQG